MQPPSSASFWWIAHQPSAQRCTILSPDDIQNWPRDQLGYFYHPVAAMFEQMIQHNRRDPSLLRILVADGTIALSAFGALMLPDRERITYRGASGQPQEKPVSHTENPLWKNLTIDRQARDIFTARIYNSFGRTAEALRFYMQALRNRPQSTGHEVLDRLYEAWFEFAKTMLDSATSDGDNMTGQIRRAMRWISGTPLHIISVWEGGIIYAALVHEIAGWLREEQNDFAVAMRFYDMALEELRDRDTETDRTPNLLIRKGCVLRKLSAFGEAIECLNAAQDLFLNAGHMRDVARVLWELLLCYKDCAEEHQANDVLESCRHFALYSGNYDILNNIANLQSESS
jgi:tetratricopeptide (TPR) repeat protein